MTIFFKVGTWWVAFSMWFLECRMMSARHGKTSKHSLQVHCGSLFSVGFSLWLFTWCDESSSGELNVCPHTTQLNFWDSGLFIFERWASSECRTEWRSNAFCEGKRFWHSKHSCLSLSWLFTWRDKSEGFLNFFGHKSQLKIFDASSSEVSLSSDLLMHLLMARWWVLLTWLLSLFLDLKLLLHDSQLWSLVLPLPSSLVSDSVPLISEVIVPKSSVIMALDSVKDESSVVSILSTRASCETSPAASVFIVFSKSSLSRIARIVFSLSRAIFWNFTVEQIDSLQNLQMKRLDSSYLLTMSMGCKSGQARLRTSLSGASSGILKIIFINIYHQY